MEDLTSFQGDLYWGALLTTLIVALLWEVRRPVRRVTGDQRSRWTLNFALLLINQLIAYAALPVASFALALEGAQAGWGFFNRVEVGLFTSIVASVLAIDLAKYLQHHLLHRVPFLWRIHRTHHADPECDVTTSFRFHPLEVLLSWLVEAIVIVIVGVPASAAVLYQAVRVALTALVHANVSLTPCAEKMLRWFVVTPDLHRIHHSADVQEQRMNLSGGLIWWDRLFGTYIAQPALDPCTMPLGLAEYERSRANSLKQMLLDPASLQK